MAVLFYLREGGSENKPEECGRTNKNVQRSTSPKLSKQSLSSQHRRTLIQDGRSDKTKATWSNSLLWCFFHVIRVQSIESACNKPNQWPHCLTWCANGSTKERSVTYLILRGCYFKKVNDLKKLNKIANSGLTLLHDLSVISRVKSPDSWREAKLQASYQQRATTANK